MERRERLKDGHDFATALQGCGWLPTERLLAEKARHPFALCSFGTVGALRSEQVDQGDVGLGVHHRSARRDLFGAHCSRAIWPIAVPHRHVPHTRQQGLAK